MTNPKISKPKPSKKTNMRKSKPPRKKPAPADKQVFRKPPTPSKYTYNLQQSIAAMIQAGNFATVAATYHGISGKTHRNWMSQGEAEVERLEADPTAEPDPYKADYVNYFNAIIKAEAFGEVRAVNIVMGRRNIGEEPPTANDMRWAGWWLERSKRERWSQSHDVNLHGPNNGPIEISNPDTEFVSRLRAVDIITISQIFTTIENQLAGDSSESGDVGPEPVSSTGVAADRPGSVPG